MTPQEVKDQKAKEKFQQWLNGPYSDFNNWMDEMGYEDVVVWMGPEKPPRKRVSDIVAEYASQFKARCDELKSMIDNLAVENQRLRDCIDKHNGTTCDKCGHTLDAGLFCPNCE